MTIERDNDAMDELVSQTYRDHCSEQVPDALNQRVLKMAAGDTRPSSSLSGFFAAWTKPLAWAATVGLSLAIVLEVSQLTDGPLSVESPQAESVEDQFKPKNDSQFEDARNQARLRAGPGEDDANLTDVEQETFREQDSPEQELAEPKRSRQVLAKLSTPDPRPVSRSNLAAVAAAPEASADEVAPDRQAGAPSAVQQMMKAQALPSTAIASEKKQSADSAACDETSRETASDWLACIEELRLQGASEDAKREYDEYELRFSKE